MLAVATPLYDLLQHLAELAGPARVVQRAYRSHSGRSLLALSRHQVSSRGDSSQVAAHRLVSLVWWLPAFQSTEGENKWMGIRLLT